MSNDFPEYFVKETKGAVDSKGKLSAEQTRELNELVWKFANDPRPFAQLSGPTEDGKLLYKSPSDGLQVTFNVDFEKKVLYFFHFAAPLAPRQTIFISYASKDKEWLDQLKLFLQVLESQDLISFWDDSRIQAGERWEQSIQKALDASCAAVLLVSQHFLVSTFITTCELPRLLSDAEREGKKIFWIPLSPSTVFESHKEITVFEALTEDPSISLAELSKPRRQRLLVKVSARLSEALRA
jgi:hypothetical protein